MKLFRVLLTFSLIMLGIGNSSTTMADEALTVYGTLFVSIQASEEGDDEFSEVKSTASRVGIKGKNELSDGIEGFYRVEWLVDVTDSSGSDNLKSRDQIVGIRGKLGEVFVGRSDTPMKRLARMIDLFNDLESDLNRSFNGENRASNFIQYTTPKFENGFGARVAFIAGEDPDNGQDSLSDSSSIAITYDQKNLSLNFIIDSGIDNINTETARFVSQYKMNYFTFGFLYQTTDNGTEEEDGFVFSTAYKNGNNTYKFQHADSDINTLGLSSKVKYSNQSTVGIDHKLNNKAKVFAYYTVAEDQTGIEDNYLAIGIKYKF